MGWGWTGEKGGLGMGCFSKRREEGGGGVLRDSGPGKYTSWCGEGGGVGVGDG